jgi:hypothetical protein
MRTEIRIPFLVLVCLGSGALAAPAQRQGQILERQARQSNTGDGGDAVQSMQRPVVGFVYGSDGGELRAILGIPGASVLGGPLAVPAGIERVHFAPLQKYALLERETGASISLTTFQGAQAGTLNPVCGAIPHPDIISFSPSGNAAALYSKTAERIQVITGLPRMATLVRNISRNELPDEVKFLAVADYGAALLAGTVHNEVYLVYLLEQESSPRFLHSAGDLGGIAFTPGTNDSLVFDREAGRVLLFRDVHTASSNFLLAEGVTGVRGQVLLQVQSGRAIIAGANSNHLWEIDLQSLEVQDVHLPITPLMLQPLRAPGTYLLFYQPGLPAWILDTSGGGGAVSFVPATVLKRTVVKRTLESSATGTVPESIELPGPAETTSYGPGCAEPREPVGEPRIGPPQAYYR